ncbi:MAG TPA: GYD domain-containing protein [Streptosporangiaceae bacterium]|nr:GYD domain-containing protein [Streptosporangiaceae bacterium]
MPMFLSKFTYTPEAWAALLANPEDRREALGPVIEAAGGKLHGVWYAFGDADGYVLFEMPDPVSAASGLAAVVASGRLSAGSTTCLLTVEEMLEALRRSGSLGYRPPGG